MSRQSELAALGRVSDTGALSNRNLIINGAMQVWQRGTSFGGAGYHADRFSVDASNAGNFSYDQSTDAPTGFEYSTKVTTDTTFTATSYQFYRYNIEGTDAARLALGSSNASTFTLSFWVKSSLSGVFSVAFTNAANNYTYPTTYTINAANTWEYKTVTVTGATAGTWIKDTTSTGLRIKWDIGSGSTFDGTKDTWVGTDKATVAGSVKLSETSNATWQITGVQLEVGDTATEFEHRSYGDELQRCQRYYECLGNFDVVSQGHSLGINNSYAAIQVPSSVNMRVTPTVYGTLENRYGGGGSDWKDMKAGGGSILPKATPSGKVHCLVINTGSYNWTTTGWVRCSSDYAYDAEL